MARCRSRMCRPRHVRFSPITEVRRRIQVSIWLSVYEYTPLVVSVFWCSRGAPTQEEAQPNIQFAHRLEKARVIERPGLDRIELCCLHKVRHLCLGRFIITRDEHLDLAVFAAFGREEPKVTTVSAKCRKIGTGLVVIVSAALQLVFSWKDESTSYPPWSRVIALGRWPASFFPSSCRRRRSLTCRPRLPPLLPGGRSRHHLRESRLRHPRDQRSPRPPRWEPRLFPLRPLQG